MTDVSQLPPLSVTPLLEVDAENEHNAVQLACLTLKSHQAMHDMAAFSETVLDRQKIHPPLLGEGIALPHARTSAVTRIVFSAIRLTKPVSFGSGDAPVRLLFLFGVPPNQISEYLATTAALIRKLREPGVVDGLMGATTTEEFLRYVGCGVE